MSGKKKGKKSKAPADYSPERSISPDRAPMTMEEVDAGLNSITKGDLTELKALVNPPKDV